MAGARQHGARRGRSEHVLTQRLIGRGELLQCLGARFPVARGLVEIAMELADLAGGGVHSPRGERCIPLLDDLQCPADLRSRKIALLARDGNAREHSCAERHPSALAGTGCRVPQLGGGLVCPVQLPRSRQHSARAWSSGMRSNASLGHPRSMCSAAVVRWRRAVSSSPEARSASARRIRAVSSQYGWGIARASPTAARASCPARSKSSACRWSDAVASRKNSSHRREPFRSAMCAAAATT